MGDVRASGCKQFGTHVLAAGTTHPYSLSLHVLLVPSQQIAMQEARRTPQT